jgi:hypothetical protein
MPVDVDSLIPKADYYKKFIEAYKVKLSLFERLCKTSYKILKLRAPKSVKKRLEDPIYLADMKVTPDEVWSLTVSSLFASILIFLPLSLTGLPLSVVWLIFPPFLAFNAMSYPGFYSEVIRVRAGNETVSIILYMVTYLSLNPVYEKAIQFAAARCHGPLGNDLKKAVWDVNVGEFSTVRSALSTYSKKWTLWNEEFVNSLIMLQLIESQTTPDGKDEILKRATEKIMTSTCYKMEDYAYKLKGPSTILMLFGIFMPLIGLVMFPMISIFLAGVIDPLYIGLGYTIFLPFFIWWFLYRMISKRPATYSHSDKIEEVEPNRYINIKRPKMKIPIIPVAILMGFVIALPGLMYFSGLISDHHAIFSQYSHDKAVSVWGDYCLNRYSPAMMLKDTFQAMFVIWGAAIAIIFATHFRSRRLYEFDLYVKKLEEDFTTGLFELQVALQENIPIESAILKVIDEYKRLGKEKSTIAGFFSDLYDKVARFSISIRNALFGKDGLVSKLPSALIRTIMEIVTSALYRGSVIASGVVKNIATYLNRLAEIEHTIKKSMKDIVSNLSMQAGFIAPVMAAIVASSAVIIIQMLQAVAKAIQAVEKIYSFGTDVGGTMSSTLSMFNFRQVMPPTVMELIAGVYLIEIVFLMGIFITGIDRGFNKVQRDRLISKSLTMAIIIFTIVFFIMVLMFQPIVTKIGGM